MMKKFNKKFKHKDMHAFLLMKLAIVALVLFLITVWPGLHDLVIKAHWGWYLGAFVIFMLLKKSCLHCK